MQFSKTKILYIDTGEKTGKKIMFNCPVSIMSPASFMSSTGVATNMSYANFPYSGVLPMMYTNFGGDLQVTTIEPYSGYNVGILFNPLAAQNLGISSMYANSTMTNPPDVTAAAAQQAQQILKPIYNNMASQEINCASQTIQCAKTKLEAELNKDGIKDEDKEAIQRTLDKIKELEEKLNKLKESTDLDPQTAFEQAKEINNELNQTLRDAQKAAAEKEAGKKAEEAGKSEDADKADTTDNTGDASKTDNADDVKGTKAQEKKEKDTKTKTATDNSKPQGIQTDVNEFNDDIQAAVDCAYNAMNGIGTGSELYSNVLDYINKDNVMQLMTGWNKYHSGEKGESFMEAFMWDAASGFLGFGMGSGKKIQYGRAIATALRQKAEELGVYDQCRADFAAIDKEMGSWFYVNNDVYKNYDNIIKIIGQKMGSKYAVPSEKLCA